MKSPLSVCGRIEKTYRTVPHGSANCAETNGPDDSTCPGRYRYPDRRLPESGPRRKILGRPRAQGTPGVSLVTVLELYAGCRSKRELTSAEAFVQRFLRIDIDSAISNISMGLFKKYRLSHGLMIADCLIAATAMGLRIPLATKNCRDFFFIDGLTLERYR
ncbi:MAG: type II toxin-antitoxin system VapC family toxin [Chromatiaceae bacterium]|nr:type II toxin-antitoxin system VapC family toxin [Chromatiaceae bacterium]